MTPLREKIVNNAASWLRPGEQVQGAFSGQSISGWWSLLTYLMFFWLRFRAVLVTDQRILVLDTGKWSATKPKGVVAELPLNVVIGPPQGLWWKCLTLGEKLYVHKRFHKDVRAADTILAESGQPVQQIPLGGHRSQPVPAQGQPFAPAGDQQQWQQGQPQQYGAPAQPGQPQPGQPQPGQPQQYGGQPQQWAQQPGVQPGQPQQPGQAQHWAQPDPRAPQQAPASGTRPQEQPSPWNRDPRLEEPAEDNRTRIRPAAPRPDQGRSDQGRPGS